MSHDGGSHCGHSAVLIAAREAYDAYKVFCRQAKITPLTGRAFGDPRADLDMYSLLRARVLARGRYGRTREIQPDLPEDIVAKVESAVLTNLDLRGYQRTVV